MGSTRKENAVRTEDYLEAHRLKAEIEELKKSSKKAGTTVSGRKGWTREVVMERLPFSKQVAELREASVLVAVHGQAAANVVFMRPGSALLLVLPPGREDLAPVYTNLAAASGIRVFVYAERSVDTRDGGSQAGQALTNFKAPPDQDVRIDTARFEDLLQAAVTAAAKGLSDDAKATGEVEIEVAKTEATKAESATELARPEGDSVEPEAEH